MSWVRVAVACGNGIDIDQSLEDASSFRIYDVDTDGAYFVEVRPEEVAAGSADHSRSSAVRTIGRLLEKISDCSLLLVRHIGNGTGGKFQIGWVTVYEAPMPMEKALKKLIASPLFRRALNGPADCGDECVGGSGKVISLADRRNHAGR